jgi:hypothetical protein
METNQSDLLQFVRRTLTKEGIVANINDQSTILLRAILLVSLSYSGLRMT